jgi:ribosomal protein L22
MAFYDYSLEFGAGKAARAQGYDANCSYKDLTQVCGAVKGKPYAQAISVLEDALSLKKPLPYSAHAKGTSHKSQLGGKRGRFPQNESRYVLGLLRNAFANAQSLGLDEKTLTVVHAQAYKQNVFPRYKRYFATSAVLGYGKNSMIANYSTARVELALGPKGLKASPKKTKKVLAAEKKRKVAEKKAAAEKAKAETKTVEAKTEQKAAEKKAEAKSTEAKPTEAKATETKATDKTEVKS